jgi:hypothetical protein
MSLVQRHHELLADVELVNEYGPTEATVWATAHRLSHTDDRVKIGRPIPGTTLRTVDANLSASPEGVAGELLISSPGVVAGYLDGSQSERFVDLDGRRWYRTGDRVRIVDGVAEFVGRTDDQLNVGGVRLEPGEVEAELERLDGIRSAVVVAAGEPPMLVAHVEADSLDEAAVRSALAERLPNTSIPRRFQVHAELPRTPNGKVDRVAAALLPVAVEPADATVDRRPDPTSTRSHSTPSSRCGATCSTATTSPPTPTSSASGATPWRRCRSSSPSATPSGGRSRSPRCSPVAHPPAWSRSSAAPHGRRRCRRRRRVPGRDVPTGNSRRRDRAHDARLGRRVRVPGPGADVPLRRHRRRTRLHRAAGATGRDHGRRRRRRVRPIAEELAAGHSAWVWSGGRWAASSRPNSRIAWPRGTGRHRVAMVDTFFPGEERHLWSNRWWKYKSMLRPGALPDVGRELQLMVERRVRASPRASAVVCSRSRDRRCPTSRSGPRSGTSRSNRSVTGSDRSTCRSCSIGRRRPIRNARSTDGANSPPTWTTWWCRAAPRVRLDHGTRSRRPDRTRPGPTPRSLDKLGVRTRPTGRDGYFLAAFARRLAALPIGSICRLSRSPISAPFSNSTR